MPTKNFDSLEGLFDYLKEVTGDLDKIMSDNPKLAETQKDSREVVIIETRFENSVVVTLKDLVILLGKTHCRSFDHFIKNNREGVVTTYTRHKVHLLGSEIVGYNFASLTS